MTQVAERLGHTIDAAGMIHHQERPVTWADAEKIAGKRLDRRRSYKIINGDVCTLFKFTQPCSGCFELGDYGSGIERYEYDDKAQCHVGFGCDECGHTGKRRSGHWTPIRFAENAA